MLSEETIQKMIEMKLMTMAVTMRELLTTPPSHQLSWEERIGMLVDREWTDRENRRVARRIKEARLATHASIEEVACDPARGLDRAVLRQLGTCQWVRAKQNVIVIGPTGIGKTYLAAALAEAACRKGLRALFLRVPRLVEELAVARVSGAYAQTLARIGKIDVLVLDDFLLTPMKPSDEICSKYSKTGMTAARQSSPRSCQRKVGTKR